VLPIFLLIHWTSNKGFLERAFVLIQPWRKASNRELAEIEKLIAEVSTQLRYPAPNVYIEEDDAINACAMGKATLCITSGALRALTKDELKAVIGHEFAHFINNDSSNALKKSSARLFVDGTIALLSKITAITAKFLSIFSGLGLWMAVFVLGILLFVSLPLICFLLFMIPTSLIDRRLGAYIDAKVARAAELKADAIGASVTSPKTMIDALQKIQKATGPARSTFFDRLLHSHPNTEYRIDALDLMTNSGHREAV
jgi:heat shock protein HtpX